MPVPANQLHYTWQESVEQCRRNRRQAAILEMSDEALLLAESAANSSSGEEGGLSDEWCAEIARRAARRASGELQSSSREEVRQDVQPLLF